LHILHCTHKHIIVINWRFRGEFQIFLSMWSLGLLCSSGRRKVSVKDRLSPDNTQEDTTPNCCSNVLRMIILFTLLFLHLKCFLNRDQTHALFTRSIYWETVTGCVERIYTSNISLTSPKLPPASSIIPTIRRESVHISVLSLLAFFALSPCVTIEKV
jgi:hypothetical protein